MSEKVLLILGGVRVGDTFHIIPFFNYLREQEKYLVTWVHGTYAQEAVKLITQHSHLKELFKKTIPVDDGFPGNYEHIIQFRDTVMHKYHLKGMSSFDYVVEEPEIINPIIDGVAVVKGEVQTVLGKFVFDLSFNQLKLLASEEVRGDYIAVQPFTLSNWKNIDDVLNVDYPLPTKSLGLPNETLLQGAEDLRGKPIEEVALAIRNCQVFVGQHSALTVLAYYLGVPTIAVHFMEGLFQFSAHKDNCIDLLKPNVIEIRKAIDKLLGGN